VNNHTRSSHVSPSSNHNDVPLVEFNVVDDFVLDKVKLDSVVDFDSGVGVSDRSTIVGNDVWDTLGTELMSSDFAEFEVCFLGSDSVDGESTFNIV
jgi:hypothetical protein